MFILQGHGLLGTRHKMIFGDLMQSRNKLFVWVTQHFSVNWKIIQILNIRDDYT